VARDQWVAAGITAGWMSRVLDYNAVSIPVTVDEDEMSEDSGDLPCIHGIRLYRDAEHAAAVRESHGPTQTRAL
jgi:hypothetical protein